MSLVVVWLLFLFLSYIYVCYTALNLGENPIYTSEWRLLANVLVFFLAIMPHHVLVELCHVNINIFSSYRQVRERSANNKRQCKQSMPEWHLETYLFSRRCQSSSDFISVVSKWHWCWGKQHKNVGSNTVKQRSVDVQMCGKQLCGKFRNPECFYHR